MKKSKLAITLAALMERTIIRGKPISANYLSKEADVPQSTISRILGGVTTNTKADHVQKLAKYFKVTEAELRGEAGPPLAASAAPTERRGTPQEGAVDTVEGEVFYLTYVNRREMEFLSYYRSSNEVGRQAIEGAAKAISSQSPLAVATDNVRQFKR